MRNALTCSAAETETPKRDDDMEGQEPSHTSAKTWEILLIVVFCEHLLDTLLYSLLRPRHHPALVVVGILATVVYVKARQRRRKQERRESGSVQSTSDLISGPSAKKTITINSKTIEDVLPRVRHSRFASFQPLLTFEFNSLCPPCRTVVY